LDAQGRLQDASGQAAPTTLHQVHLSRVSAGAKSCGNLEICGSGALIVSRCRAGENPRDRLKFPAALL
jgi:hypothetical protein